jgi:hypothetical protein
MLQEELHLIERPFLNTKRENNQRRGKRGREGGERRGEEREADPLDIMKM